MHFQIESFNFIFREPVPEWTAIRRWTVLGLVRTPGTTNRENGSGMGVDVKSKEFDVLELKKDSQ